MLGVGLSPGSVAVRARRMASPQPPLTGMGSGALVRLGYSSASLPNSAGNVSATTTTIAKPAGANRLLMKVSLSAGIVAGAVTWAGIIGAALVGTQAISNSQATIEWFEFDVSGVADGTSAAVVITKGGGNTTARGAIGAVWMTGGGASSSWGRATYTSGTTSVTDVAATVTPSTGGGIIIVAVSKTGTDDASAWSAIGGVSLVNEIDALPAASTTSPRLVTGILDNTSLTTKTVGASDIAVDRSVASVLSIPF